MYVTFFSFCFSVWLSLWTKTKGGGVGTKKTSHFRVIYPMENFVSVGHDGWSSVCFGLIS